MEQQDMRSRGGARWAALRGPKRSRYAAARADSPGLQAALRC
jgi:hypothetical protein